MPEFLATHLRLHERCWKAQTESLSPFIQFTFPFCYNTNIIVKDIIDTPSIIFAAQQFVRSV